MTIQPPSPDFLEQQIRWVLGRGLPVGVAEDIVHDAWVRAVDGFRPDKGKFEPFMQRIVRNMTTDWWRNQARTERTHDHLRLLRDPGRTTAAELNQQRLLDALDPQERDVFAAWALQKHLGKGQVTSEDQGRSLGMTRDAYENAKRRLRTKLNQLFDRFGWTLRDLLDEKDEVQDVG